MLIRKVLMVLAVVLALSCGQDRNSQFGSDSIEDDNGGQVRWTASLEEQEVCVWIEGEPSFCQEFDSLLEEDVSFRVDSARTNIAVIGVVPEPTEQVDIVFESGARASAATTKSGGRVYFAWVIGFSTEPVAIDIEAHGPRDEAVTQIGVNLTDP